LLERPFAAGFLRVWLPDDRVFEDEALPPRLFDDAGGEDVRVAMVRNLRDRHTSPTLHTPVGTHGP
jgi:hypothetical protein